MKRISALILAVMIVLALAVSASAAEDNATVKTLFTVVGCNYDEESGYYSMAISYRNQYYWQPYEHYHWYFTTANVRFVLDDDTVYVRSDGSEVGNEALTLVLKGEPVPLGTVVEIEWSGEIQETYPPRLVGIVGYTFTGYSTDYSVEDIISEQNNMNEMGWNYTLPANLDDIKASTRADFTVVHCDAANVTDSEYHKKGATLYLALNMNGYDEFIRITPDFEKTAVIRDSDDAAAKLYENFLKTGEVPQGTVVEIVWSGMVNESYPAQLAGVYEIRFTSKDTEYTAKRLNELYNNYAGEFDLPPLDIAIENPTEPALTDSEPSVNSDTGANAFAGLALAGILIWSVAVIAYQKCI